MMEIPDTLVGLLRVRAQLEDVLDTPCCRDHLAKATMLLLVIEPLIQIETEKLGELHPTEVN